MKKSPILFILISVLILNIAFIAAEEIPVQESTEIIKEATGIEAPTDTLGFKESTNKFLETKIILPDAVKNILNVLFHLEGNMPSNQNLIILIALWIIILLLIQAILEIMPLFGEDWKSWLAAAVITALVSITGAIQTGAVWIFDIKAIFGKIGNYGFFFLILNIIIMGFVIWGLRYLIKIFGRKIRKSVRYQKGFEQGAGI